MCGNRDKEEQQENKMTPNTSQRSIFQRIMGSPATDEPGVAACWEYQNGLLTIDLTRAPELQQHGGALRLEGRGLPLRVLVVHGEDGAYRAYHNRCTHFGHRRLDPVPGTDRIQCCSISGSTFDASGKKLHGPAPKAITPLPVTREQNTLTIQIPNR